MLFGKVLQAPGETLFKATVTYFFFLFGLILAVLNPARQGVKKTIQKEKTSHDINSCFRSPKTKQRKDSSGTAENNGTERHGGICTDREKSQ
jgi:hypothetical protein